MKSFKTIFILIGLIITICISFVVGLFVGQKNAPKNDLAISKIYGQTFYAKIESIKQYNDGSFHLNVKGLEINDINYRGDFTFKVTDSIDMTWQGQKISISDLKEGDIISITFTDEIITSISPTPLQEVVRVQLLMDKDNLESVVFECQRTYDLTYFLSYCLKMVDKLIDGALDDVANAEKIGVKHDYYQSEGYPNNVPELNRVNTLEDNKAPQVTPSFVNENTKVEHEEVKVTTKETIKVEPIKVATSEVEKIPEPVTKKPEQKIEEIKESDFINTTSKQTFAHESVSNETGTMVNFAQNIAISNLPTGLSEEEASKLENHLLELNPYLTRGQAYFYARHCTIGMCYTISQYKKEVGCAYETARCSMDNLVTLGYYVKKQLKNKYIYTPVKKG